MADGTPDKPCDDIPDEAPFDPAVERRTLSLIALVPNMVTLMGLCAGLTSIRYAVQGDYQFAAALIVLAALIDGMDGLLARKLNAASSFGAELDSLSDFVCFGVAPGVFVYNFVLQDLPGLGWPFVLVYVLCACLRLARFNVASKLPAQQGKTHFVGVPAPAGAMLCLFPVYVTLADWVDLTEWPLLVAAYVAMVGLLMVSRLPTPSIKSLRVPRRGAVFVLLGVAVFAGALAMRPWWVLAAADLAYLGVVARSAWVHRRKLA